PAYQRRATVTANPSEPSAPWADSRRTCRRMPRWLQQRCPEGPGSLNQSFASYPFTSFRERLEKHVVQPASGASSRRGHREGFLQEAEGGGQPEGRRQLSPACPDRRDASVRAAGAAARADGEGRGGARGGGDGPPAGVGGGGAGGAAAGGAAAECGRAQRGPRGPRRTRTPTHHPRIEA